MHPLVLMLAGTVLLGACAGSDTAAPDSPRVEASATELRATLSEAMRGNRVVPYGEAWDVLSEAFALAPGQIRLFYTRRVVPASHRASGAGQRELDYWNREHLWPQSYGIASGAARTDLHNLAPTDQTVNSARGNKWFDELSTPHAECTGCAVSADAWEPPAEAKGDVARVAMYMDVRYEGTEPNGVPDLVLAEEPDPDAARFGVRSTLVRWHCEDPVSGEEVLRHEVIAQAQGNRNVFVDSPELAEAVYGFDCGTLVGN